MHSVHIRCTSHRWQIDHIPGQLVSGYQWWYSSSYIIIDSQWLIYWVNDLYRSMIRTVVWCMSFGCSSHVAWATGWAIIWAIVWQLVWTIAQMTTCDITSIQMYILIVVLFVRWLSCWFVCPNVCPNLHRSALVAARCAAWATLVYFLHTYICRKYTARIDQLELIWC